MLHRILGILTNTPKKKNLMTLKCSQYFNPTLLQNRIPMSSSRWLGSRQNRGFAKNANYWCLIAADTATSANDVCANLTTIVFGLEAALASWTTVSFGSCCSFKQCWKYMALKSRELAIKTPNLISHKTKHRWITSRLCGWCSLFWTFCLWFSQVFYWRTILTCWCRDKQRGNTVQECW